MNGITVSPAEEGEPVPSARKLGAYLAAKKYHIRDRGILSAITCHTTGKPQMSLLDKILYIADYIERTGATA